MKLKNNWVYFLWFFVYIFISWLLLGATLVSFGITILLYGISISIALSPIGEHILRYIEGCRRIATKEEKEYLFDIYNEVYEQAREKNPKLSEKIELFVTDKMYINAFAVGKNSICLTKGSIEAFSEDELKGVIAHELGHISNGDTIAILLNVVGNGIFTILVVVQKIVAFIVEMTASSYTGGLISVLKLFMVFVRIMLNIIVLIFMVIGQVILSINSRKNEYNADRFAYEIGYGDELTKALYMLQKTSLTSDMRLIDRLRQSHPHLAFRIKKLETAQDEDEEREEQTITDSE